MAATFSFLFIDDEYLRTYTPLGKSIDIDQIYPFVSEAQNIYTQDLFGTPLYNYLEWKLYTGLTFSTTYFLQQEIDLINIASKALAYWTIYLALPHLAIQIRNIGLGRATAENVQVAAVQELKYIREEMQNLAEFWNQRVVNYICENSEYFPLYNAKSDDMYPQTYQYDSDIYIEDRYKDLSLEEIRFLKKYLS
jgi:hypothetical protein